MCLQLPFSSFPCQDILCQPHPFKAHEGVGLPTVRDCPEVSRNQPQTLGDTGSVNAFPK